MRIALTTAGTRGDTQPLALLALELRRRGHEPVLGVSPNTVELCRRLGLTAYGAGPDTKAVMESERGQAWLAAGDVGTFMKELTSITNDVRHQTREEFLRVSEGADIHVSGVLMQDYADPVAERDGVPMVALHSFPVTAQRLLPHPLVTTRALPGPGNRLTCALFDGVWWRGTPRDINEFRAELGLPHARSGSLAASGRSPDRPAVQMYDPALVPGLSEAYGQHRPVVGFVAPDAEFRDRLGECDLPDALATWLDAGAAPVFLASAACRSPTRPRRWRCSWTSAGGSAYERSSMQAGPGSRRSIPTTRT